MSDVVRLLLEDRKRRDEEIAEERRHREEEARRREEEARRREEEARQREKERREEMALLKSLVESSRPAVPSAGTGEEGAARIAPVQEKLVLAKFVEGDDVDAFLTTFERVMTGYKIPEGRWAMQLAPQLSGKAQQAYASLGADAAADYREIKKAILRRYDVCEETYRQRFRFARKKEQESYSEFASRLRDLADKWLAQCDSVPSVIEKVLREQLLDVVPTELRVWLCERKPKSVADIGVWADDYQMARKRRSGEDPRTSGRRKEMLGKEARTCHSCKKEGHIAANCPEKPQSQPQGRPPRLDQRKCFNCHERGHIALQCPKPKSNPNLYCEHVGQETPGGGGRELVEHDAPVGEAVGNGTGSVWCEADQDVVGDGVPEGEGEPCGIEEASVMVCAGYEAGKESEPPTSTPEGVRRIGRVEGVVVDDVVLDTGCSQTMVRQSLVPEERLVAGATTSLRCAHGDVMAYPLADVRMEVGGTGINVRAAVSERLPVSVILGTDVPEMRLLLSRPRAGEALVVTRAQAKRQTDAEREAQRKEVECQVRPNPVESLKGVGQTQELETDGMPLAHLDDDLFETS